MTAAFKQWQFYCISNLCLHKPSTSRHIHTHTHTHTHNDIQYVHTHTLFRHPPLPSLSPRQWKGQRTPIKMISNKNITHQAGGRDEERGRWGWMACQASSDIYKMNCGPYTEAIVRVYALRDAGPFHTPPPFHTHTPPSPTWQISYLGSRLTCQQRIRRPQLKAWLRGSCRWRQRWVPLWVSLRCHEMRKDDS